MIFNTYQCFDFQFKENNGAIAVETTTIVQLSRVAKITRAKSEQEDTSTGQPRPRHCQPGWLFSCLRVKWQHQLATTGARGMLTR